MLWSFTALPPEIRSVVYSILLHDTLSNKKRLIYDGACPDCCTTSCQEPETHDKVLPFASRKFNALTFPHKTLYVHLADFGDLLRLAATCKLLRTSLTTASQPNAATSSVPCTSTFQDPSRRNQMVQATQNRLSNSFTTDCHSLRNSFSFLVKIDPDSAFASHK
ncbi:hypothetical protein KCU61_g5268, partial [Aureobasidium melanogenum]